MIFINKRLALILLLQFIFMSFSLAKTSENLLVSTEDKEKESKLLHNIQVSIFPINQRLLDLFSLLEQSKLNANRIDTTFAQLSLSQVVQNPAEQYLMLLAQALIKVNKSGHNSVNTESLTIIALLEQAKTLFEKISEQQLSQPEFLQLHLILAEYYAGQGQYDLAYLEKKSYLKKYYIYRKNKRINMIASVEELFEVKDKKANNSLLESQNNLKVRRVEQVEKEQAAQQYNFTLIISVAIVFVLLFFRQLIIRNKLIELTRTDALTGLANRSALFEHGDKMVTSFADKPEEFSVLLLDLDHFKRINDNFGHQVGDKILIVVSHLVKETMRSRDVFYRLGGEEFVALLPFADANKAKAIAMRINEKISQHDFSSLIIKGKVTVSIGVATMKSNQLTFDDVLHGADLAMYQAKEQGRNTVVCYQSIAVAQERRINTNASQLPADSKLS